jgi:hypothetical protein
MESRRSALADTELEVERLRERLSAAQARIGGQRDIITSLKLRAKADQCYIDTLEAALTAAHFWLNNGVTRSVKDSHPFIAAMQEIEAVMEQGE